MAHLVTTTDREDVWEQREETVWKYQRKLWKPRNENVLSDEHYGDDHSERDRMDILNVRER